MTGRVEHIGDATQRITAIYALCEYPSWEPRYVGKTVQYLHERHKAHLRDAKSGRPLPVHSWIRKKLAAGDALAIKLLEYVPPGRPWADRENYWINTLRASGNRLLNLTAGGEGLPGHVFSVGHRNKIAAALRTGRWFDCETCGKRFWRRRNEIIQGNCRFCSRACYAASLKGIKKALPPTMARRGVERAAQLRRAQTHCRRGHEYTAENTRLNKRGARVCRACVREAKARAAERRNG